MEKVNKKRKIDFNRITMVESEIFSVMYSLFNKPLQQKDWMFEISGLEADNQ